MKNLTILLVLLAAALSVPAAASAQCSGGSCKSGHRAVRAITNVRPVRGVFRLFGRR